MKYVHAPTNHMPKHSYTFRLFCHLCGKTIAAAEEPIPSIIKQELEGTPCSDCVKPSEYAKQLRDETCHKSN